MKSSDILCVLDLGAGSDGPSWRPLVDVELGAQPGGPSDHRKMEASKDLCEKKYHLSDDHIESRYFIFSEPPPSVETILGGAPF